MYQIRFVLQYARGKVRRALRNTVSADGWKQMWSEIESTSRLIDQGVQDRLGVRALETWRRVNDIETRAERIESLQQATLAAVQTGNEAQLLLSLPFAGNAIFDSAETLSADAPCLPGTQRRILSEIQDWAENPNGEVIFWLHGMAGTGKTSVALTVANALNEREPFTAGRTPPSTAFLGASFFFKQGDATRNNTATFFPTLARCLAEVFPDFKSHIVSAINERLAIGTKAPSQQLRHLIVEPLSVLDEETYLPVRLVVVVDALDECLEQEEAKVLLEMLATLEHLHQVQLRLLITSRRDKHLVGGFERLPSVLYRPVLLDKVQTSTEKNGSTDDITFYLSYTLAKIAEKHGVSQNWIDEADVHKLSQKADGLFIYAATACRFLDAEDFADEEARLERLEQIFEDDGEVKGPQQKVDEIYLKVLSFPHLASSTKKTRKRVYSRTGTILGFLAVLFEPVSVSSLGVFVSLPKETLDDILRQLNSIVSVPQDEKSPLGLVHLSFRDFILNEERSKQLQFRIEETAMHRKVLRRCLDIMSSELFQDICKVILPAKLASEVPRRQIEQNIPQHLRYACRYWIDHLAKLDQDGRLENELQDNGEIHAFLKERFLYWLEAMSFIGETPTTITMINKLQGMINPADSPGLFSFAYDARRFVLANRWVIDHAPLQIYASALIFSPQNSVIRSQFTDLMPPWITQKPITEENWTPLITTLGGQASVYYCIAFSPTEDLLASVSSNGTASLWDYITGTERFKFEGRGPREAHCVSFSADGKRIAIGLDNGSLQVREFAKGKVIELRGHGESISHVAFSPRDHRILASVGTRGTRLIWNVDKRRIIHKCRYSGEEFGEPVSFSGDGSLVYFAGQGGGGPPVLMSVETGDCIEMPETGEDDDILTTTFSIDGQTVATATKEAVTIKDLSTGIQRFQGPSKDVTQMAFSPDGKVLALVIGQSDVELHDVKKWAVIGSFHTTRYVEHIAFCRDGNTIAIYGGAGLQLWDTSSVIDGLPVEEPTSFEDLMFLPNSDSQVLGHSADGARVLDASGGHVKSRPLDLDLVRQARTSPDKRFVAMSGPRTQLWDSSMSKLLFETDESDYVVFSQDGTRMVLPDYRSGCNLRVFDTKTFEETWELSLSDNVWLATFEISPNGQFIGSWSNIGLSYQFQLWDLATQKSKLLLAPEDLSDPSGIIFSPDSQLVAPMWLSSDLRSVTVKLIEVATGRDRGSISHTNSSCLKPVFHNDNQLFVSVKDENFITGWDTKHLSEKFFLEGIDKRFAKVSWDLIITPRGQLVAVRNGHDENLDFMIIHQWEISTGKEIGRYRIEGWLPQLELSDDGRYLTGPRGRLPLSPSPITSGEKAYSGEFQKDWQDLLYLGERWVFQGLTRLVWLPPQHQENQGRRGAARGETVALGGSDGGVRIIKFDLAKTPLVTGRIYAD
ncbi:hypothetical protein FALCPG4_003886 [Fusarium falciforme]